MQPGYWVGDWFLRARMLRGLGSSEGAGQGAGLEAGLGYAGGQLSMVSGFSGVF